MNNDQTKRDSILRLFTILATRGFDDVLNNRAELDGNAKQVLKAITCFIRNMSPIILQRDSFLYRARIVNPEDITSKKGIGCNNDGSIWTGFNEKESGRPPEKAIKAGRLNRQWESIWYLASDKYTAMAEVRPAIREQISVAEYQLGSDSIKILDFSGKEFSLKTLTANEESILEDYDLNEIYVLIQKIFTLPSEGERTYYISNMIAELAKKTDISGIVYKSFYGPGNNIALWKVDDSLLRFKGSSLFLHYSTNMAFLDINAQKYIDNSEMFKSMIKQNPSMIVQEVRNLDKHLSQRNER